MRILVCISQVPDTTSKITFTDNNTAFNTTGVQYIINPYDEIALAKAIEVALQNSGKVTVINVGLSDADATIRKALAAGADDAVRIDAKPRDAWFVANQIANYVKSNTIDLILTGRESIDYNGVQVASMLGELLNIPSISIAKKIDINGDSAEIEREIEGGKEVVGVKLPVVIGTSEGVAEPKIPNMRGIMSARTKPLEVIQSVEVNQYNKIENYESPEPRGQVNIANTVDELVDLLHTKAKVI